MPLSLHSATIPGWLQILGSVRGLVDKARDHCRERGFPEESLIEARLVADMRPLSFQLRNCTVHSRGAIEAVMSGSFSPSQAAPKTSFDAFAADLEETISWLQEVNPAELDAKIGKDVSFIIPGVMEKEFTAENYLFGFAQPNFFFHATTAYDVLRAHGVHIGKRDFLGALPEKPRA